MQWQMLPKMSVEGLLTLLRKLERVLLVGSVMCWMLAIPSCRCYGNHLPSHRRVYDFTERDLSPLEGCEADGWRGLYHAPQLMKNISVKSGSGKEYEKIKNVALVDKMLAVTTRSATFRDNHERASGVYGKAHRPIMLTGTIQATDAHATIAGTNTKFSTELVAGDRVLFSDRTIHE